MTQRLLRELPAEVQARVKEARLSDTDLAEVLLSFLDNEVFGRRRNPCPADLTHYLRKWIEEEGG